MPSSIPAGCNYGNTACTTYFVLYSKWGISSGDYESDGGFEEWKVKKYPTLTIIKNAIGGDGTFNFTVLPSTLTLSLTTVGGTATQTFIMDPGSYTLAETVPTGWTLNSRSCSVNGGTPTTNGTFTLTNGNNPDNAVCTVTNSRQHGKIELRKLWSGTAGSTVLQIGTSAGGTQVDSQVVNGVNGTTGENAVVVGTYFVSETAPTSSAGSYTTILECFDDLDGDSVRDQNEPPLATGADNSVAVGLNDDVVCVFTNTFVSPPATPAVTLVKRNSLSGTTTAGSIPASAGTVGWQWLIDASVTGGAVTATVTDTIPVGLTIGTVTDDAASIGCSVALQIVTCILTATPVGVYVITIPVTAPAGTQASNCRDYTNRATVTGVNINAQSNDNTVAVTSCAGGGEEPAVALVKRNSLSGTTTAGSIAASASTVGWQWLIDVSVTGGAANGTVTDSIPVGLTIGTVTDDAASIGCSVASQVVTCTLTATPVGVYLITIPVTALAGTQASNCRDYTNRATVTGVNINAQSNDNIVAVTSCAGGGEEPAVTLVKRNSLSGTTTAGSIPASAGTVGWQWLIDVSVTGGAVAATVTDSIPAGLTIGTVTDNAASIGCSVALQIVTCTLTATPVGAYLITIPVTAPAGTEAANCRDYTNRATVTGVAINAQSNDNTVTVTACAGGGGGGEPTPSPEPTPAPQPGPAPTPSPGLGPSRCLLLRRYWVRTRRFSRCSRLQIRRASANA